MTIDLLSPFWGGLIAGIILLNIAGILKFAIISTQKKAAEDHISNLISELYSLNKNYKEEISKINQRYNKDIKESLRLTREALALYDNKVDKLIQDNRPPGLLNYYNQYAPSKK
jgi:hypothetical protein